MPVPREISRTNLNIAVHPQEGCRQVYVHCTCTLTISPRSTLRDRIHVSSFVKREVMSIEIALLFVSSSFRLPSGNKILVGDHVLGKALARLFNNDSRPLRTVDFCSKGAVIRQGVYHDRLFTVTLSCNKGSSISMQYTACREGGTKFCWSLS